MAVLGLPGFPRWPSRSVGNGVSGKISGQGVILVVLRIVAGLSRAGQLVAIPIT